MEKKSALTWLWEDESGLSEGLRTRSQSGNHLMRGNDMNKSFLPILLPVCSFLLLCKVMDFFVAFHRYFILTNLLF